MTARATQDPLNTETPRYRNQTLTVSAWEAPTLDHPNIQRSSRVLRLTPLVSRPGCAPWVCRPSPLPAAVALSLGQPPLRCLGVVTALNRDCLATYQRAYSPRAPYRRRPNIVKCVLRCIVKVIVLKLLSIVHCIKLTFKC